MLIREYLSQLVRATDRFNPEYQVCPHCILWPDKERQWQGALGQLLRELPELIVLGEYDPDKRTGPAIWVRCAIAGTLAEFQLPQGAVPIVYLPGVSRQDLRAVDRCPEHLKPIVELQFRGAFWSQLNTKDWTVFAFLKSDSGGLNLDVQADADTRNALQRALLRVLEEDIESLRGKRLTAEFFNELVTGGDTVRQLLIWLENSEVFRAGRTDDEWRAFVEVLGSRFSFDPEKEGPLGGAQLLAERSGPWSKVWDRFCEAPERYRGIPQLIRRCTLPQTDLLADAHTMEGWPQWNEAQENMLRNALGQASELPVHKVRTLVEEWEGDHAERRRTVWAELGEAPLARALEYVTIIARGTKSEKSSGTIPDLEEWYTSEGWKVDAAVIDALASVKRPEDSSAIRSIVRMMYIPWADAAARLLQEKWHAEFGVKAAPDSVGEREAAYDENLCVFFVDGLRFDCGQKLAALLTERGCSVSRNARWAALPSVTGTGKPAVSPVSHLIREVVHDQTSFEACSGHLFKKLLKEDGWKMVDRTEASIGEQELLTPSKCWYEFGDIDHQGHEQGAKLAQMLDSLLTEIADRIVRLLNEGWSIIKVVTDHGWLLVPDGLPKEELSSALIEHKWGRCAMLKPRAHTEQRLYPWHWDQQVHIALPDGINCYRAGEEYGHGGLSLQECLTPGLTVSLAVGRAEQVKVKSVTWKGLRCTVELESPISDALLDLRLHAGDVSSSLVVTVKGFTDMRKSGVIVEDDNFWGKKAYVVIMNVKQEILAQTPTFIGGEQG